METSLGTERLLGNQEETVGNVSSFECVFKMHRRKGGRAERATVVNTRNTEGVDLPLDKRDLVAHCFEEVSFQKYFLLFPMSLHLESPVICACLYVLQYSTFLYLIFHKPFNSGFPHP